MTFRARLSEPNRRRSRVVFHGENQIFAFLLVSAVPHCLRWDRKTTFANGHRVRLAPGDE